VRGLTQTAEDVVAEALERFHPGIALACSFQKEESVLLDMLMRTEPGARVFTIDTGVLFNETRETWRAVEQRYGVKVEVFDALSPDGKAWTGPENCCSAQKVAALQNALEGLDAWMTGLRKEQAATRTDIEAIAWDERNGLWRASPLAEWTERDVWNYIAEHDLPYNRLHDEGYSSIGCAPCTLPGSGREGRWAGSEKTECGLHGDPEGRPEAGRPDQSAEPDAPRR